MISVIICRQTSSGTWEFDTWLMSCRVLGRRVQNAVLQQMLELAAREGIRKLVGVYRPTEKNKLVEDHYAQLGFIRTASEPDGTTRWELAVAGAKVLPAPMTVRSIQFNREVKV